MGKDQITTPGTLCPTLYDECVHVGSLTPHADHNSEDAGDGAYSLSSLSEKTRISNHVQMSLQRQHILLSYFKTLSVGPVWGSNPKPPSSPNPRPYSSPTLCQISSIIICFVNVDIGSAHVQEFIWIRV